MQKAFTIRYKGLTRTLHTQVGVCLPFTQEETGTQRIKVNGYLAIWDTGATHSAITKKVADELGLKPTGIVDVKYGSGLAQTNDQQSQLLIGMDIIGMGDFAVTNADEKTVFSFRVPSIEEIDFVPEAKENNILKDGNRKARRILKAKRKHGKK